MWIKDLPHETIEKLCCALERAPTMDWQMLMRRKPLCNFFPPDPDDFEDLINLIASSASPAKAFLDDLTCREITIQDLVNGLRHIGNKKAISIIERGIIHRSTCITTHVCHQFIDQFSQGQKNVHYWYWYFILK